MPYYTSKFKLKNRKNRSSTNSIGVHAPVGSAKWRTGHKPLNTKKKTLRQKLARFRKVFVAGCGLLIIVLFIAGIYGFSQLQVLTETLPSPDKPFGVQKAASEMFDRNGKLLYTLYGDENRNPVNLTDVPPLLKWSILAAEDINFYDHPGVDILSIIRCGVKNLAGTSTCGGSTITQQLIKQTALTNERSWTRKIKEIILALQIEKLHTKDEIMGMYLNVIPEGSNLYGIQTASQSYFGKDVKDLNLAQMAIIASIPQDPSNMSPTHPISGDTTKSQQLVKDRQLYVLDQLQKNMDYINTEIKNQNGIDNALTQQMIDDARVFVLDYTTVTKQDVLKAPHFVFYVEQQLQAKGYNNGEPFTLTQLDTNGYKIYTTLDLDDQEIAEEQVKNAVDVYGKKFGADNAALIHVNPKNGEIMAMAGSYDYFGISKPAGCSGDTCTFNPEVNVLTTLQSYGSSMKPMVYYDAIESGLISAGSIIPDIPIKIGNYKPKDFGNYFSGLRPARIQLADSQNIPAISLVDALGVDNFVNEMKKWGYTTLTDPRGYGPSIAVGGADVKLIEHAQAYTILANAGVLVPTESVLKIIDRDGNVIFNYEPKGTQVADPRAAYIVSDILNANNNGPGINGWNGGSAWSGLGHRDIAGKTGTSEDGKETLFCTYTPEMVVVGWLGNNNNKPMRSDVSGFQSARPWIAGYALRIADTIPSTPFTRPAGVVGKSPCDGSSGSCSGYKDDLGIVDINPPSSVTVKTYTVCTDQTDHLARQIDIDAGMAETIAVKSFYDPDPKLQSYLDDYVASKGLGGTVPTELCNVPRATPTPIPTDTPIPTPTVTPVVTTTVPTPTTTHTVVPTPTH